MMALNGYQWRMSTAKSHILSLASRLGAHEGVTHWAISMRMVGKGDFLHRLERGGDCRTQTYERAMDFFARTWPADLQWPPEVPRPVATAAKSTRVA
jgi:hypothetical protein